MQANSPVVMKDLIDIMMTLNAGIATYPSTHVENSMMKATTQTDLNNAPLKEEVEGVRGDVEDTTDMGAVDQVDMVEDQVGMVKDQVGMVEDQVNVAVMEGQEGVEVVEGQEDIEVVEGQEDVEEMLQDGRKVGNTVNGTQ